MTSVEENKETHEPCVICSGTFIVVASILCPIIMCAITFPLFLVLHHGKMDSVRGYDQIPTISGTGQYFPESLFFTYGLHLEGLYLAILFMFIYAKFRNRIAQLTKGSQPGRNLTCSAMVTHLFCFWRASVREKARDYQYLTFWNKTLTTLGITAAFLMTAVGTTTLSVEPTVHTALAFTMFGLGILHMLFFYFTLARIMDVTYCDLVLHRVCLIMTIPFNILLLILIGVLWVQCPLGPCVHSAVTLVPVIEYSTAVFLLLYLFRFNNIVESMCLAVTDTGLALLPGVPVVQTEQQAEYKIEEFGHTKTAYAHMEGTTRWLNVPLNSGDGKV